MSLPLIMLVAYIAITVIIGVVVATRGSSSSRQFLTAQGNLVWFNRSSLLLFAEMMAGAATIGKAATGFTTGISAVWVNWGMSIGMIVFIVFAARFYRAMHRKYDILSVPEAFKFMFDQRCRTVMLVIIVVTYCFLYSSQPISAAALIAPMVGLDPTPVAWFVSALFVAVTLLGGMKGLAIMNIAHMVVMYGGLIAATSGSLDMVGGLGALYEQLPSSYFDLLQPDIWSTLANAIGIGISFIAAATMVTATISARSARDMAVGAWGAAVIVIRSPRFLRLSACAVWLPCPMRRQWHSVCHVERSRSRCRRCCVHVHRRCHLVVCAGSPAVYLQHADAGSVRRRAASEHRSPAFGVLALDGGAARYRGHMARAQCVIHPGSTVRCVSDTLGCGNRVVGIHGVAARVQYGCVLVHVAGRHRRCRVAFRRQPSGHGAFVARMWHHHRRIGGIDACQQDKGLRRVRALQRGARRACSS